MEAQVNNQTETATGASAPIATPTHNFILPRPYLSASAISNLLKCQRKFEFDYIENRPRKTSPAQLVGLVGHSTFESYYTDKLKGSYLLTGEQMSELAITFLEDKLLESEFSEPVDKDALIPSIKNTTTDYINFVGVPTTPKVVEEEIRYKSRCGVEILGYVDLIREPNEHELAASTSQETAAPPSEILADYKITGKKWPLANLTKSLQFHLYAMATGIQSVEIQNVVNSKKKGTPKQTSVEHFLQPEQDLSSNIRLLRHTFPTSSFDHIERIIEGAAKIITAGNFMPTDPSNWWCDPRFCDHYQECRGS